MIYKVMQRPRHVRGERRGTFYTITVPSHIAPHWLDAQLSIREEKDIQGNRRIIIEQVHQKTIMLGEGV